MLKAMVTYPDLRAQLARELVLARLEREVRLRRPMDRRAQQMWRTTYVWQVRSLIRAFEHLEDRLVRAESERSAAMVDRIVGPREVRVRALHSLALYAGAAAA